MTETLSHGIVTITDQVYQILRDRIERQEIPSGERLIDNEIATSLGVSRTPVRDAINRLAAEGMVTVVPRRGAFVASLSAKAIKDLYEVREVLESLAVRLAIPQLTDDDIQGLNRLLTQYEKALGNENDAIHLELDQRFHETLIRLSGNEKLFEMHRLLEGTVQITRWIHCETGYDTQLALQDHKEILAALAARDAEQAVALLCAHIRRVNENLVERLE